MFANVDLAVGLARIRSGLLLCALVAARHVSAQTISGRVYDSLANVPLIGATVQLVSSTPGSVAPTQAITDSLGNYRLSGVPAGAYLLGFYHALLDSIGLEPPVIRITIDGINDRAQHRVDLGVPSAAGIIAAVCGPGSDKKDGFGVLVGRFYDAASRQPVSGGTVVAEWRRIAIVSKRIDVSTPQLMVTTTSGGGFAFCGVPHDDDVILTGIRGKDTTGSVTVHVSAAGFAHRQLYVDSVDRVPLIAKDSLGAPQPTDAPTMGRRGHGRLVGTVVDAADHRPLPGARVSIVGTDLSEVTNDRGTFSLLGAPGGSQAVLVRAVGYAPEHRTVDLLNEETASVDVGMTTLRNMLDTMRITAGRLYSHDATGFDQRRKSGFGRFFDSTDVARFRPFETTRLLEGVNGVRLAGSGANLRILMGTLRLCQPTIVVDGITLPDFSGADLNAMVAPEEISGVEVYATPGSAPVQYKSSSISRGGAGCGSIVIWTKRVR